MLFACDDSRVAAFMEALINAIGTPLGYLMYWCYELLKNYGAAILLFTLLTKVILFPLSLVAQKNSIKMVKMQPELADIRVRNGSNGELVMQETKELYKKEGYSTIKGILPLLVQIPLILGLIDVIYKPMQHLLHIEKPFIAAFIEKTAEVLGVHADSLGYGAQLRVVEAVQSNPAVFSQSDLLDPGLLAETVRQITSMDLSFLGINLAAIPSFGDLTIIVPLASGLSALALSLVQNKYNVLQAETGFLSKWGMAIFLVLFSGYFALILPCGLGVYWTAGNLLSIPVLALCNVIYSPKKYIDYANRVMPIKLTRKEKAAKKASDKALARRAKLDSKRFYAQGNKKNLVVYSEGRGYWKYFSAIIHYLMAQSDMVVHYVTNDPDDPIFDQDNPRIAPYYIGPKALISFMMKMDADIILMTTPDLDLFHVKRSLVRKDTEYIYLDHGMTSYQLTLRKGALDAFDTIFVYGPNHIEEVRETEKLYGLAQKTLVKTGYGLLDDLLEKVQELKSTDGELPQILIAPSWQEGNILDLCIDEVLGNLLGQGFRLIVRPHPEYVKRYPARMNTFMNRYERACTYPDEKGGTLEIETDFSSNETVYSSDLVITDWSSIAQEFSYATKRPSLFINTPMKVMNPEYDLLPLVPLDISLRDELGVSLNLEDLGDIQTQVNELLRQSETYREHISKVLAQNMYDIGNAAQGAGDYLIGRVKEIEYLRRAGKDPAQYAPPAQLKASKERVANTGKARGKVFSSPSFILIVLASFVTMSLVPSDYAWAYIDPATTTYIIQIAAAIVITLGVSLSVFIYRFQMFMTNLKVSLYTLMRSLHKKETGPEASKGQAIEVRRCTDGLQDAETQQPPTEQQSADAYQLAEEQLGGVYGQVELDEEEALASGLLSFPIPMSQHYPKVGGLDWVSTAEISDREDVHGEGEGKERVSPEGKHPVKRLLSWLGSDTRSWKERALIAFVLSLACSVTFIVFSMFDSVIQNVAKINFSFAEIVGPVTIAGLVACILVFAFLMLFRGRVFNGLICLLTALLIGGYLQSTFLNASIGSLTGKPLTWEELGLGSVALNAVLWVAIFIVVFYLGFTKKEKLKRFSKKFMLYVPALIVAVQLVALLAIVPPTEKWAENQSSGTVTRLTSEGLFEISANENVIIIILDMLDEEFIEGILEEDPSFFDGLDGFTRFSNNLSVYNSTFPSIAHMMSGLPFDPTISSEEYLKKAYGQGYFVEDIKEQGFTCTLYTEEMYAYADGAQFEGVAENLGEVSYEMNTKDIFELMTRFSLLKSVPLAFKGDFSVHPDDFRRLDASSVVDGKVPFAADDPKFYEDLKEQKLQLVDEPGRFIYYHLNGSHYPFHMDADAQYSEEETSGVEQTKGCFHILEEYFNQMKEAGVYEDATIIITGDHPTHLLYKQLEKPMLVGLFVKPSGSAGEALQTSNAPVSLENIRASCVNAAGGDGAAWGKGYFEVGEDEQVERDYFNRYTDGDTREHHVAHYSIRGDAQDWDNWELVELIPYDSKYWF